jgi:peptidoglycan L-alanyl-D-glutamate endopeptidase CwlK
MLTLAQVQAKSAKRLEGLNPIVKKTTEELIARSFAAGVPIIIVQGLRTIDYQNQLYAQGRTAPGAIVTNAKGGHSFHNFGLAVDFALLMPDGKVISWDTYRDGDTDGQRDWLEVAAIGKALGFEWGGDWAHFLDMPHFQMVFGLTTAQLRTGAKPPTEIIFEEDQPMTKEERAAYEALEKKVEEQGSELAELALKVKDLETNIPAPNWFITEFGDEVIKKINDPTGTLDFWRSLSVSLRVQGYKKI